ncbi:His-Xaa-Ser system radical SAM maturase HxsC [Candidatus Roizmanbacteria bacterium]|nr:His-Xaa-Ser system radical SAM maturase HxsC [Candidatus Roizmanbacteria bacterium]
MKLHIKAKAVGIEKQTIARITKTSVLDKREDYFLLVDDDSSIKDYSGYAGIIAKDFPQSEHPNIPLVYGFDIGILKPGHIISVDKNGFINVVYRPESQNNIIFATARCNNHCLMCSQPPKESHEYGLVENHLRLIDLINDAPETLCITGGEPTLLNDQLIAVLSKASICLPETNLYMLTNGRQFADETYVRKIAAIPHLKLLCAIPVYADVAPVHDYIVQAKGAFSQTINGLYNLARYKLPVEIRVVLHKQTIPRLLPLMEFIYRNLPFVSHVALMGLENMGYTKINKELLWIDPLDYLDELEKSVRYLHYRQMSVSIFNLQLCVLKPFLYPFARKSISDFKNIFLEECEYCSAKDNCSGLFKSSAAQHSRGIKAFKESLAM